MFESLYYVIVIVLTLALVPRVRLAARRPAAVSTEPMDFAVFKLMHRRQKKWQQKRVA